MQSLVFLVAVVALSQAAVTPDAVNACVEEGLALKTCVFQTANETFHKNIAELKDAKLKDAVMGCFQHDDIKNDCHFDFPTPSPNGGKFPMQAGGFPMGAGGHPMPTPSADAKTCFDGAKGKLMGCINKELGLPEDFKPKGMDAHPQGRPPMPPMGHLPPFPHDPKEMHAFILNNVCGGKDKAAKALEKCAMDIIMPHKAALAGIANPMVIACQAGAACHEKNKISAGCMDIMKQGGAAFCKCRDESAAFMKDDPTCAAPLAAFKDSMAAIAAQHVDPAAGARTDMPEHPHHGMPMEFCHKPEGSADAPKKNPMEMCKNILGMLNATPKPQ